MGKRSTQNKNKIQEELTMTIQKKSLINSLNTTKKAIVASTPKTGTAEAGAVKAGLRMKPGLKAGAKFKAGVKTGVKFKAGVRAGAVAPGRAL
jgi:hypothetical protein